MKNLLFVCMLIFFVTCLPRVTKAQDTRVNLALGKTYTMTPSPNYPLCTDANDHIQLTDGQAYTGSQSLWTLQGTVGWSTHPWVVIQIDLETVEPIGGIEMNTAAGRADVSWPAVVYIHVSDDGNIFRDAGELMSLDLTENGPLPEPNVYTTRCLSSSEIRARGRFVRFIINRGIGTYSYVFTDELRVFRCDNECVIIDGPIVATDPKEFYENKTYSDAIRYRHTTEIANIRRVLAEANIAEEARQTIAGRLNSIENDVNAAINSRTPPFDKGAAGFRTIFPLSTLHQEIFQTQAAIWNAAGMTVHAVPVCPWDNGTLAELPAKEFLESKKTIEIHAMRGEYRAAAFNIYNSTDKPLDVSIRFEGIPLSEFTVHDVPWTDTRQLVPVLAALPYATRGNNVFSVNVLPGLVKQVYLTFRPMNLPAKLHEGSIILDFGGAQPSASIPLKLTVWDVQFPEKPSLLVGGFEYTDGDGMNCVTPKNMSSFLNICQEHFVNAPWARSGVMTNFTVNNATKSVTLNTARMDAWLDKWTNAREYCIYLDLGASLGSISSTSPDKDILVASWITAWVEHWKSKGIEPEQINLLVVDEPSPSRDITPIGIWCPAIRKAQPKVKLWTDPIYVNLSNAPQDVFELHDVISPQRRQWLEQREAFDAFYFDWQKKGKTLQLYDCASPVRLLDPYSYFRLQAWECARIGGTGSFFWNFGGGTVGSSWNEYAMMQNLFTPLFIDPDDPLVVGSKHFQALREGTEDFELILMLQRQIEQQKAEGEPTADAEAVLKQAIESVIYAQDAQSIQWEDAKDRSVAEQARLKILGVIIPKPEMPTAIYEQRVNTTNPLYAFIQGDRLIVRGLHRGEPWSVFNVMGALVYRGVATDDAANIMLPAPGLFVIQSGENVLKIVSHHQ